MWRTCLVVLLALGAALAFDREEAKERLTAYRIRSQNLHIDKLEEEVDKLQKEFDSLSAPITEGEVARIKARVKTLEGNQCGKREVSCGGDIPECVPELFVCDGRKDCKNGRDEDADVCSMDAIREGSSFHGVVHWKDCFRTTDHNTVITITANRRSPFFGPRAWVRAHIASEVDDAMDEPLRDYQAKGYFSFGARKLALMPDAGAPHQMGIVCDFIFGDNDHADCRVVNIASLKTCGVFRLDRS